MPLSDLNRIKQFVRVAHDIETALSVTLLQKKILLKLIDLHTQNEVPTTIGDLASSVEGISSRSVLRHLDTLKNLGWIKIQIAREDQRIKYITPTPRLIRTLSHQLSYL